MRSKLFEAASLQNRQMAHLQEGEGGGRREEGEGGGRRDEGEGGRGGVKRNTVKAEME